MLPITMTDVNELIKLRDKLLQLEREYKDNRLDFMEWERYPEQNKMREMIIDRLHNRTGPNIFVIFGGNRSGKSELGGGIIAYIAKEMESQRIWCATLSDLSIKVQQRKLKDLVRIKDIEYGEYNEVRGWKNKTIITKKKSVIYFKTYDQGSEAFQGDDIDVAWFDEECPYDVFQETLIRIGDRQGCMVVTFTSLQGFTRLVNRLWETNDPNVKTTVLTPEMNPFLTAETKKQLLGNMDEDEKQSRWEGKPHLKSGLIYKEFGDIHKVPRFDYVQMLWENPRRYKIYDGIDPHDRVPHHWLRFLWDRESDELFVVEELKAPFECMLVNDFARMIHTARGKKFKSNQELLPEHTEIDTSAMRPVTVQTQGDDQQTDIVTVRNEFHKAGIPTMLVIKDNALGIDAIKGRLKVVRTITGEIKRKPRLYVFDDLSGVKWEFMRYAWESYLSAKISERREILNTPLKKDDHYMDIIKYMCLRLKNMNTQEDVPQREQVVNEAMGY